MNAGNMTEIAISKARERSEQVIKIPAMPHIDDEFRAQLMHHIKTKRDEFVSVYLIGFADAVEEIKKQTTNESL